MSCEHHGGWRWREAAPANLANAETETECGGNYPAPTNSVTAALPEYQATHSGQQVGTRIGTRSWQWHDISLPDKKCQRLRHGWLRDLPEFAERFLCVLGGWVTFAPHDHLRHAVFLPQRGQIVRILLLQRRAYFVVGQRPDARPRRASGRTGMGDRPMLGVTPSSMALSNPASRPETACTVR